MRKIIARPAPIKLNHFLFLDIICIFDKIPEIDAAKISIFFVTPATFCEKNHKMVVESQNLMTKCKNRSRKIAVLPENWNGGAGQSFSSTTMAIAGQDNRCLVGKLELPNRTMIVQYHDGDCGAGQSLSCRKIGMAGQENDFPVPLLQLWHKKIAVRPENWNCGTGKSLSRRKIGKSVQDSRFPARKSAKKEPPDDFLHRKSKKNGRNGTELK